MATIGKKVNKKAVILLIAAIIASGCGEPPDSGKNGVKITKFDVKDSSLKADQKTTVTAKIENFNEVPTTIKQSNITLFNLGQINVTSKSCNPGEIGSLENVNPSMHCTWTIQAPGEDYIAGFESKPISFNLNAKYNSTLENTKPIKLKFDELDEIRETESFETGFSNGDISMSVEGDKFISVNSPGILNLESKNSGPGKVLGNLSFSYDPSSRINFDCPSSKELIRKEVKFPCSVKVSSTGTYNLFISTSYKYQKSKGLGIEVVNNQ